MTYAAQAGLYEIHWEVESSGSFILKVTVPFGAKATVVLPNKSGGGVVRVEAGTHCFCYMPDTPIIKGYSVKSSMNE